VVLQQQKGREWENIASVRRCGSQPQKLEISPGTRHRLDFEFRRAFPYSQRPFPEWITLGKHRLAMVFSTDCAPAINNFNECLNQRYYPSVEFDLKRAPDPFTPTPNT
jgi:hypothetical protein